MYLKLIEGIMRDCLYVRDDFLRRFPKNPGSVKVNIGSWSKELKLVRNNRLPRNTLGISAQTVKGLTLPNLQYNTVIKGRNLQIGPVLGLLGFKKGESITSQKLNTFKDYFGSYDRINGLAYLFGADGIQIKAKRIKGYYYNPAAKSSSRWLPGTFPLPGALYRRAALHPATYRSLSKLLGRKMFNGYFLGGHFNKWDLWKWLSPNKRLRGHLPETVQLSGLKSLDGMLERYGQVYLKPTMENMSKGIIKVRKGNGQYEFIFPENNSKQQAVKVKQMSAEKASEFIQSQLRKKGYIIQRAVQMKRYNRRAIDFRVILQKNEKLQWSCTAIIARFGKRDGIITNFGSAGYAMNGNEALTKVFRYNKKQSTEKYNEIIRICLEACKVFEAKGGNYADVGLDVMLDTNGKVWILELNVQPDHKLALIAKKREIYRKQIVKPLLYAKALAGF